MGLCAKCRYFLRDFPEQPDSMGICRRYPPMPAPGAFAVYPRVGKYYGCGEFAEDESEWVF